METTYEIPLHNKAGDTIALARVDEEDWLALKDYRWSLIAGGYAVGHMTTRKYKRTHWRGPRVGGAAPMVYMHRVIMGLQAGDKRKVDHINRDRLDNRRANLRVVTNAQHSQNQSPQKGRSSQYRGVTFNKRRGKWMARGQLNGKQVYLGAAFTSEEEAAAVAAEWRKQHMTHSDENTV